MKRIIPAILFLLIVCNAAAQRCECPSENDVVLEKLEAALTSRNVDSMEMLAEQLLNKRQVVCQVKGYDWMVKRWMIAKDLDKVELYLKEQQSKLDELPCDSSHYMLWAYNKALLNFRKDNLDSAAFYYLRSLRIAEQFDDANIQYKSLYNLGAIFSHLRDPKQALVYMHKSVDLMRKENDSLTLTHVLTNIAGTYSELFDFSKDSADIDLSLKYAEEAMVLARIIGNNDFRFKLYTVFASDYYHKSQFDLSSAYCDSIINDSPRNSYSLVNGVSTAYYLKSDLMHMAGKYGEGLRLADSSMYYAQMLKERRLLVPALRRVYKNARELKLYDKALFALEEMNQLNDSITGLELKSTVAELEQKYNKVKNEQTITALNHQQEVDRLKITTLTIGIVGAVLLILLLGIFFRQSVIRNKQAVLEAKQRLNRARMDPHFFFNTLSSVHSALLEGRDNHEVADYLAKSTGIMRHALESTFNDLAYVEEEIEFLEDYLKLQTLRFPHKFDYSVELSNDDIVDYKIPSMLIQPFLENSIEHGFKGLERKGMLTVALNIVQNELHISISDNGVGFNNSTSKDHRSRAMEITKDRLFLLNKQRKAKAHFNVSEGEGGVGVRVDIFLPLIHE